MLYLWSTTKLSQRTVKNNKGRYDPNTPQSVEQFDENVNPGFLNCQFLRINSKKFTSSNQFSFKM